jgi:MFS family permease
MQRKKAPLPIIVFSQFAGTSLWFVGNAVLPELKEALHLSQYAVSLVTSAVMLGFVAGTLFSAILSIADRFSPVKVFLFSNIAGALMNLLVIWLATSDVSLFALRFMVGFFLAGIYPVGMKIAGDWYDTRLGRAMGFLLGALVLGTAFPHLLKNRSFKLPWEMVLMITSAMAVVGGLLMYWRVGDGPHRKKAGAFQWSAIPSIFSSLQWRRAAFGYFGHMWELYTFWGFLPLMLALYGQIKQVEYNIPLLSFSIIASGVVSSIAGGISAQKFGSDKVATVALTISGTISLLSPFLFQLPPGMFFFFMFLWGFTVNPDSPQFSTLVSFYAPAHLRGTALAIYNAIGFSITTISLSLFDRIFHSTGFWGGTHSFSLLALGALFGVPPMLRLMKRKSV